MAGNKQKQPESKISSAYTRINLEISDLNGLLISSNALAAAPTGPSDIAPDRSQRRRPDRLLLG